MLSIATAATSVGQLLDSLQDGRITRSTLVPREEVLYPVIDGALEVPVSFSTGRMEAKDQRGRLPSLSRRSSRPAGISYGRTA